MSYPQIVVQAVFLALAVYFVAYLVRRLPRDRGEFATGDRSDRIAIGVWWGFGVAAGCYAVNGVYVIGSAFL